jgi:hypothetical protein
LWRFHFQHHDRDDDGKNTITERFQSAFVHSLVLIMDGAAVWDKKAFK